MRRAVAAAYMACGKGQHKCADSRHDYAIDAIALLSSGNRLLKFFQRFYITLIFGLEYSHGCTAFSGYSYIGITTAAGACFGMVGNLTGH